MLKIIASTLLILSLAACGGGSSNSSSAPATPSWETTSGSDAVTKLQVIDNTVGTGATAAAGNNVTVNYTGWLYQSGAANFEGPEFGASTSPFGFALGTGQVIAGWDQGLVGMKVGGTRTLIIPSALGYGPTGNGPIPGGAALVFTVQLVSATAP